MGLKACAVRSALSAELRHGQTVTAGFEPATSRLAVEVTAHYGTQKSDTGKKRKRGYSL